MAGWRLELGSTDFLGDGVVVVFRHKTPSESSGQKKEEKQEKNIIKSRLVQEGNMRFLQLPERYPLEKLFVIGFGSKKKRKEDGRRLLRILLDLGLRARHGHCKLPGHSTEHCVCAVLDPAVRWVCARGLPSSAVCLNRTVSCLCALARRSGWCAKNEKKKKNRARERKKITRFYLLWKCGMPYGHR